MQSHLSIQLKGNDKVSAAFIIGLLLGAGLVYATFMAGTIQDIFQKQPILPVAKEDSLQHSLPVHINIPAVNIEADFEDPVGVNDTGELEVPKGFDTVAWYKHSPTPGEVGPAVVLGHVDSYVGPEIFHQLWRLKPGSEIEVLREDGTIAVFAVTHKKEYPQSQFPFEEVYGDIDHAGLRLITCSGTYDHGAMRYSHNLIIFAALTRIESAA